MSGNMHTKKHTALQKHASVLYKNWYAQEHKLVCSTPDCYAQFRIKAHTQYMNYTLAAITRSP